LDCEEEPSSLVKHLRKAIAFTLHFSSANLEDYLQLQNSIDRLYMDLKVAINY
jgi:hypothetical protein